MKHQCTWIIVLAVAAAMPLMGQSFGQRDLQGIWTNATITPFEADLAWIVKMDKGQFIGRDALAISPFDADLHFRVGLAD